jgi:hypothetical protein
MPGAGAGCPFAYPIPKHKGVTALGDAYVSLFSDGGGPNPSALHIHMRRYHLIRVV